MDSGRPWHIRLVTSSSTLVFSTFENIDLPLRFSSEEQDGVVTFHQPGSQTGQPFYRILNKIGQAVYVGGNETLLKLSIDRIDGQYTVVANITTELLTEEPPLIVTCEHRSSDPERDCWNFIRVAEETRSGRLYVCGTNSQSRLCYLCSQDLVDCPRVPGFAPVLVPLLPDVNPSVAVFDHEAGDVLYGGDAATETFQRYSLDDYGTATFELDSVTVGLRFINTPVFVGKPFSYTDGSGNKYVFTFYRERAEEYSNLGEKLYSRIARVCQSDTGGPVNTQKFVTFIKARLNCSIPDELFPYEFDEIQDVLWTDTNGDPEAYAVFTSPSKGPKASALCRYRMRDIMQLFDEGEYKLQLNGNVNRMWLPQAVTDPRPGTCHEVHTTDYPPLLDKLVPNYNPLEPAPGDQPPPPDNLKQSDAPTLYVNGVHFTSLAVDFDHGCLYYFGTTDGTVIRAFRYDCDNATEPFTTVEITELGTDGTTVTGLELITGGSRKFLVVTTEESVISWLLSPIAPADPNCVIEQQRLLVQPTTSRIVSCANKDVFVYCEVNLGPACSDQYVTLSWAKDDSASFCARNKHLARETRLSNGLLELRVTTHNISSGNYTCTAHVGGVRAEAAQVEIVVENCLTEQSLQSRCVFHDELEAAHQHLEQTSGGGIQSSVASGMQSGTEQPAEEIIVN
ncbi:semaphorin-2A-like isoform X2 [Acanthaster planci]|uniref:Semaphorin-2A-like isoform X2 n=1 Tax=Acanthaster planci TaxID=133434 RepID=A0A8B7ZS47_ACAPL|nr:semaphorin-2A-like isoform X2 [Acanthaster planci]